MSRMEKKGLMVGSIIGIIVMVFSFFSHEIVGIFVGIGWIILWGSLVCIPTLAKLINRSEKTVIDYSYIKKNEQLYRNIIRDYSIGELAFIDGYYFTIPKDAVAILLKLELNKKIKIIDNNIKILNKVGITTSEEYILNHIFDGKLIIDNIDELVDIIKLELKKDDLLRSRNDSTPIALLIYAIIFFGWLLLALTQNNELITVVGFALTFISFIFVAAKYGIKDHLWRLTKKGKEVNLKLRGLKKFLNSFSNMEDKQKEEIALWDDYLIYSVIFGINKKIIDEYRELIIYTE